MKALASQSLVLNRYRVVRLAGKGGMGAVYEAIDERLSNVVALKQTTLDTQQLGPEQAAAARRAFEREAKLLAGLRHPAMPRVIDYFAEGADEFLVMDFIPGDDLVAQLRARGAPFPVAQVLDWADALLDALVYLHTQAPPVLHRDIKPQNIKLTPEGAIVLLDFGLARGSVGGQTAITTSGSLFAYTPQYAPLEQVQGHAMPQSDLYSLAATLHFLLAGDPPPDVMSRVSALAASTPDPLRPLSDLNPEVSTAVSAVIQRALALNAPDRPASAAELRRMLRETRGGHASVGTTVPGQRPGLIPQPAAPPARGRLALSGLAVLGVLALLAMGVWLITRPTPRRPDQAAMATDILETPPDRPAHTSTAIPAASTAVARIAPVDQTPTVAPEPTSATSTPPTPAPLPTATPIVNGVTVLRGHTSGVGAVAISPNGQILASGSSDATVRLWRLSDGQSLRVLEGHSDWVGAVAISPDGQIVVSGANDGTIRLWRVSDGALLGTLTGHNGPVFDVAVSPDGAWIASGGRDTTVRLWRMQDGSLAATLKGHRDWVGAVAFSPDSATLASGANDSTVRLWRVNDGSLITTLSEHAGPVHAVAFAPNGLLASGSDDGTVRLWDIAGASVRTIHAHEGTIWSVAFSPDGALLATGGADQTIRFWRVEDGSPVGKPRGHNDAVISVAFAPDGRTLASGSNDMTVRLWPVPQAP